LLLDVIDILEREQLAYAVIGALAASVHGVVRASMDADAVVQASIQRLRELQTRFQSLGWVTSFRTGDLDDPIPALLQVSDTHDNRVDLLAGLRGLDRRAYERVISLPFEEHALKIIGREDFIAMKVFAGGPLDMSDAQRAVASNRELLDVALLRELARGFGGETLRNCEQLLAAQST
jgi:hypothetical protein